MRVVTLLPAATEIVAALGASRQLVGISHECDYPASLSGLPRVTTTPIDPSGSSATIDAEVRRLRSAGRPVIGVEAEVLRRLAPDLIVTQGLCEVCAVADGQAHRLAAALDPPPRVLSLGATTIAGIEGDIRAVARALTLHGEAERVIAGLRARLERLRSREPPGRSRMLCIEWLDPLYVAGHWVPEMVEAAGGIDVAAVPGSHSAARSWRDVAGLGAEVIVVMLCGFDVAPARRELDAVESAEARGVLTAAPVWLLDGNAFTSRPGPRIVDGAERLRAALDDRELPGLERWTAPWPAG